ncbi:MAG: Gfo/Idh/MocA family oxidoreductase [Balneolaceae bacterium]
MSNQSRKDFLKRSALGFAGLTMAPFAAKAASSSFNELNSRKWKSLFSANDQIRVAAIGMGIIAHFNVRTALQVPGVELVAVADAYDSRLVHAKELYGADIFTTKDYREILSRDDVDAVIISTPDHWHSKMTFDALEAGKHVFCEKPMVQRIEQGNPVIEAYDRANLVMQVGSSFSSDMIFLKAAELFRSGAIGNLNQIVAQYNRNSSLGAWQYTIPESANPDNLDWDAFLGSAPQRPFDPTRFFRWRNYDDYGTGVAGDLFVHLFTGIHTVLNSNGPNRVSAFGGLNSWHDGRDAEDLVCGQYQYPETDNHPEFTCVLQSNLADGGGSGTQFLFIGDEGSMEISPGSSIRLNRVPRREPGIDELVRGYNSVFTFSEADQNRIENKLIQQQKSSVSVSPDMNQSEEYRAPGGYDSRLDHFVNFFNSIRNDAPQVQDPYFGFRAAAPSLLTNISLRENRVLGWDPENLRMIS